MLATYALRWVRVRVHDHTFKDSRVKAVFDAVNKEASILRQLDDATRSGEQQKMSEAVEAADRFNEEKPGNLFISADVVDATRALLETMKRTREKLTVRRACPPPTLMRSVCAGF